MADNISEINEKLGDLNNSRANNNGATNDESEETLEPEHILENFDNTGRSFAKDSRPSSISEHESTESLTNSRLVNRITSLARTFSHVETSSSEADFETIKDPRKIIEKFVRDAFEQGIHIRNTSIIMEDITVQVPDTSRQEASTFGDFILLPITIYKMIKKFTQHKKMKSILSEVNFLVKPGNMVLVLGRPGSGCSTLLKTAVGETSSYKGNVSGSVTYDGIPQKEMVKNYKSDLIYCAETDIHFPHLTVKQTLDFALACKVQNVRINNMSAKKQIGIARDLLATIFGLRHTYSTKVGNDFVRGVSGGERKRVSIAEALAARGTIYAWDNATRGLDASTALEFAQALRTFTELLKSTSFCCLYQVSENIFHTFDMVTVLYSGKQIYYGPVAKAKDFFERMGYKCPPRQDTAEFLTALTDPNGLHLIKEGFEGTVPRSADEFESYWKSSPEFKQLLSDIETYKTEVDPEKTREIYTMSLKQEKTKWTRKSSYYTVSFPEQVKLCTIRGFQRIYGDKSFSIISTVAAVFQSFIIGSLFYNTPSSTSGAFSRGGTHFFMLLYYSLISLANISFAQRPIINKHKSYSFYHPAAEALSENLSFFPFRMIGLTMFMVVIYFLAGLRRTASAFFITYLFLTMAAEIINCLFQMIAAACETINEANSINGILMLSLSMYSTYMIQLPEMRVYFKWISFALPLRYGFESMLNAEFHNRYMSCGGTLVPSGPGYENVPPSNQVCAFPGSTPGSSEVLGDNYLRVQFTYQYKNTWRNFGIFWCFLLGYLGLKCLLAEFKPSFRKEGNILLYKKNSKILSPFKDEESTPDVGEVSLKHHTTATSSNNETIVHEKDEVFEGLGSTGNFLWRDLVYTIPLEGSTRVLLDHVSGYCIPGKLTALMGESGAGKTTLLNTLAQRNEIGVVTGDIKVDGAKIDISFGRRTGYVQQQDVHLAELTVREALIFSAMMRRPESVPYSEKLDFVEKIIEVLEMGDYADALVGLEGSGLNVEQRKKLSIGVELVARPDILLFVDEPTSGLDSQEAWSIVQLLKRLSESGQSILCTIHQPSATLFEQFDRLLLLKKGGKTVYFGDIGNNSDTVLDYFERNGGRKCLESENPAEYILEIIGAGASASVEEDWGSVWNNSPESTTVQNDIEGLLSEKGNRPDGEHSINKTYATSYFYQFKCVQMRAFTILWRDTNYLVSKFMLFLVTGLYIGFTFFHVPQSYNGLQGALFAAFLTLITSAPVMNQIQARAIEARELYEVRESKSNVFHWSLLLLCQYFSEIPYSLVFSAIYFVSFYFPVGIFYEASRSAVFYLNYGVMFQFFYVALGLMVLYLSPNLQSANVIMGLTLSFLVAFCGVVQPKTLMPGFWTFMWKASPYTYFVQNLISIMLHDKPVVCKEKELSFLDPPTGLTCGEYMAPFLTIAPGYINNPDSTSNCGYCLYSVGDSYLERVSASYSNLWRNFGFYWAYIVFNLIAMVVSYYIFHILKIPSKIIHIIKNALAAFRIKQKNKNNN
ncbi:hypothetical protein Kpol_1037p47 [Vanderwaltozyma polyspora DSM 70294]|uniref:ABC transporter domain-containing protein n=1 Tax=Vanderwaltozyma polyspora (strain ATCC 22028 / DSM 70294 / BCRC 21397 / CBS 2163 / NBRC 10782 / NRRL Y-8283 / UCD 57-17) TaxID=436907 RepID=A7TJY8_VANPO|nr:uncharacterized protein Kpol_1037p47 [Vanderwaltozyma polyspora DSM 70294]EDO17450.1 hypothetical protein Kpol_1037p47 [Vanderwaltozyma polyspora DSM 70294]